MPREKRNLPEEICSKITDVPDNAQVSRKEIARPEDKGLEEYVKNMTELKTIQQSHEEILKRKSRIDNLPKDLVAARKMTVRGAEQNISSISIPSCSTAPDPCVPSVSRELNSYSAIYSTRSDIACSSEESANTHVNNEISYSNDSDISLLSKHVYVSDDESTDKNSPQYKHKLIKNTMTDTLETGYKRIRKEFGNKIHETVETDKKAYSTDGNTATPSNSHRWLKYMDEYPALISKLIGNKVGNKVYESVETDNKAYSTDGNTGTLSNSPRWLKYMDEYPAIMSKLIGNKVGNKVHESVETDKKAYSTDGNTATPSNSHR